MCPVRKQLGKKMVKSEDSAVTKDLVHEIPCPGEHKQRVPCQSCHAIISLHLGKKGSVKTGVKG